MDSAYLLLIFVIIIGGLIISIFLLLKRELARWLKRELLPHPVNDTPKFEPFRVSIYFNFSLLFNDFGFTKLTNKETPLFGKEWQESLKSKDRAYNLIRDGFCFTVLNDEDKPLIYIDSIQQFTSKIDFRVFIKEVKLPTLTNKSLNGFIPTITVRLYRGDLIFYLTTPESDAKAKKSSTLNLLPFATFPYSALYLEGSAEQINADLKSEGWTEEVLDSEYSYLSGDDSSRYEHKYAQIKIEYI